MSDFFILICGSVIVLQGREREGPIAVGKERDKEIVLWTRGKKKRGKVLTTAPAEIYE